jgi:hypothetical protein
MKDMTIPENFQRFLVTAKKHTYASGNGVTDPVFPGSKQLEFSEGNYLYRDIYFGSVQFIGQETVFFKGSPIWSMFYSGGITNKDADRGSVFEFLREALMHPEAEVPIRGPDHIQQGDMEYENLLTGTITMFHGFERILKSKVTVYLMHYGGGYVSV